MGRLHRVGRRMFLRDLGRGTLAVAVLGPTVIACSDSSGDGTTATDLGTTTPVTTSPVTTSPETTSAATTSPETTSPETTSPETTSPETTSPETTTPVGDDLEALRWERVSLGFVSAYVLARGREVAIVDTGTPGSRDLIGEALRTLGSTYDDVDHVILTHLHGDHVGGLGEVLEAAADAQAYAGEADVAGIASPRPLRGLVDGDEVFGLQIIATPGHTAGHISVLDAGSGLLVAGDALNEANGMIVGPNPRFSADHDEALESVRRLAARDFDTAVFGHGEPFVGDAAEAVVALAATL